MNVLKNKKGMTEYITDGFKFSSYDSDEFDKE